MVKQIIWQGVLLVLSVLLVLALAACTSQPESSPTYTPAVATDATAASSQPDEGSLGQSTPQPTDDPNLRDITSAQHDQLDQLIAELAEGPQVLADCAAEAGDDVPAPGSLGEADWYAQAAVKYSACAASKGTGVDFTGGTRR